MDGAQYAAFDHLQKVSAETRSFDANHLRYEDALYSISKTIPFSYSLHLCQSDREFMHFLRTRKPCRGFKITSLCILEPRTEPYLDTITSHCLFHLESRYRDYENLVDSFLDVFFQRRLTTSIRRTAAL